MLLINDLTKKRRSIDQYITTANRKQLLINVCVIVMTLLFIVFTSPGAVCSQFYNSLVISYTGNIILFASDCFAFSYHAFHIIILCVSNKQFFRKFKLTYGLGFVNKNGKLNLTTQTQSLTNN